MYLRLTSRCNMTCDHCAFSCGARGTDMKREVFNAALKLNEEYDDSLTLGGGEPTLHPNFWEFMGMSIASTSSDNPPFIVTNGKITKTAIALAKMAKSGAIGAALSQDIWHDRIDGEVIQAFTKNQRDDPYGYGRNRDNDSREIRNVEQGVVDIGRAKRNGIGSSEHCVCDSIVVEPTGKIWECGCRKVSFGTVFAPAIPKSYWAGDSRCSQSAA